MVVIRARRAHLVEWDTPENCPDMEKEAESRQNRQQLANKLRLLPSQEFRYGEDLSFVLAAKDCQMSASGEAEAASSGINIFAQDYDTMTLETLYNLLKQIDCDEVDRQRQRRDMQRHSDDAPDDEVELYLDMISKEEEEEDRSNVQDGGENAPSGSDDGMERSAGDGATSSGSNLCQKDGSTADSGASESTTSAPPTLSAGYTYNEMIQRIFRMLDENNEGSARLQTNRIPMPKLETVGKKKTCINNFSRICEVIHRPVEDVKEFVEKELSCKGNMDTKGALTVRFQMQKSTDLDNLLQRYLDTYVKCNSCNRIDTTLQKSGRVLELRCNWCQATRSVAAMVSTYTANMEKRSRTRAAMTL